MRNKIERFFVLLFITSLTACASAPPLTNNGSKVRIISVEQAESCRFLQVVQYTDRILSMGKNSTVMKAIGEAGIRNEAGTTGANALVITKDDSEWFLGNIGYTGEAFNCP